MPMPLMTMPYRFVAIERASMHWRATNLATHRVASSRPQSAAAAADAAAVGAGAVSAEDAPAADANQSQYLLANNCCGMQMIENLAEAAAVAVAFALALSLLHREGECV